MWRTPEAVSPSDLWFISSLLSPGCQRDAEPAGSAAVSASVLHYLLYSSWQILSVDVVFRRFKISDARWWIPSVNPSSPRRGDVTEMNRWNVPRGMCNKVCECVSGCRGWCLTQWEVQQQESGGCLISPALLKRKCLFLHPKIWGPLSVSE